MDEAVAARAREQAARYETVALVLQGGGALGAYQAGVYAALHEAGIRPQWVAGTSIGAINAALIAGNAPRERVARLREFWEAVSHDSLELPLTDVQTLAQSWFRDFNLRGLANLAAATRVLFHGQRGFFEPRLPPAWLRASGTLGATSFYDTAPLAATLARLVDFDRLNAGEVRATFGTVEVESGDFVYFDTDVPRHRPLGVAHVMASGALPPAFAPVVIGDRHYWDGGLVSNTPLEYVLDAEPRRNTLAFQVDLWSAKGELPADILDVLERLKDIQYSSRTRKGTDRFERRQNVRHLIAEALRRLPPELRGEPEFARLESHACDKVVDVVHLIYQAKAYESHAKDYEFSAASMREHWDAGYADTVATLSLPDALMPPTGPSAVVTTDIHRAQPRRMRSA